MGGRRGSSRLMSGAGVVSGSAGAVRRFSEFFRGSHGPQVLGLLSERRAKTLVARVNPSGVNSRTLISATSSACST